MYWDRTIDKYFMFRFDTKKQHKVGLKYMRSGKKVDLEVKRGGNLEFQFIPE